jgi:hypothetical protein
LLTASGSSKNCHMDAVCERSIRLIGVIREDQFDFRHSAQLARHATHRDKA